MLKSAPAEFAGAKVHFAPVLYGRFWKVIPSSFLCHRLWRAGWLRCSMARALAWPRPGSGADELQARCGAATGKELQQAGRHMLSPRACVMGGIGETVLTT